MSFAGIKFVSGGQTGADRAALDFAIAHAIPHGGACPKGRLAEDGPLAPYYQLQETSTEDYAQRTEFNVRDSDGTVIFSIGANLIGGSKKTLALARQHGKPVLHLARERPPASPERALLGFIRDHKINILNLAGPRASEEPEIGAWVTAVLEKALAAA